MTNKFINFFRSKQSERSLTQKPLLPEHRQSERGAAMLVALLVITAFIILASTASRTVTAISREAERTEQSRQEKMRAEYYSSMAEATLKYDVRQNYNQLQASGKQKELQLQGDGKLPMFDSLTVTSSRPLLTLAGQQTGENPASATSLFGSSAVWAESAANISRAYISTKQTEKNITAPEGVEIISFKEVYRRSMTGVAEPIYAFRYLVRARAGEFGEVVKEDTILLGPAIIDDSTVVVNCSDLTLSGISNPGNVVWGNAASLDITYSNAEQISIYNSGGTAVFNQTVTNEATPRNVSYTTGALTGPTNFVGEAVRGTCQIQVPIVVGVTFNQSLTYSANGAQTINIIEGDNVQYAWSVSNAAAGYTTSWITYGTDATQYFGNVFNNSVTVAGPANSTTSTLHSRDTRFNSGAEQTVTVTINVCRLPRITNYSITPTTVTQGGSQNIQFDWQTQEASVIRIVRVSDNQVIYSGNQAAGSIILTQPQVTTDYRLEAISNCGAPMATDLETVTVQPAPPPPPPVCQPPVLNSYNANPNSVIQGGNQTVRLEWTSTVDCGGTASIDNGIGNVPLNGFVDVAQPQTTTVYTITITSPGGTVSGQDTVSVTVNPPVIVSQTLNGFVETQDCSGNFNSFPTSRNILITNGRFNVSFNTGPASNRQAQMTIITDYEQVEVRQNGGFATFSIISSVRGNITNTLVNNSSIEIIGNSVSYYEDFNYPAYPQVCEYYIERLSP